MLDPERDATSPRAIRDLAIMPDVFADGFPTIRGLTTPGFLVA
jgi:hypothetical protein